MTLIQVDMCRNKTAINLGPSYERILFRALLADAMTTAPGQFQCECVQEKIIPLHPRLKMTVGVNVKAPVIGVVRQLMTNLMVMNRKDMFVYQVRMLF